MKKLVFSLLTVALCSVAFAEKVWDENCIKTIRPNENSVEEGDLAVLKWEKFVNCTYYLNDAMINKMPLVEFKNDFYPELMDRSTEEITARFIEEFNDKLSKLENAPYVFNNEKAKYTLVLYAKEVVENGSQITYVIIVDNNTCKPVFQKVYSVKGGRVGTTVNLIGDGAGELAKRFAKDVKSACR